MREKYFLIKC